MRSEVGRPHVCSSNCALLLLLAAGAGLGWVWWGWHAEQPTIARLRTTGEQFTVAPIGPPRLRSVLGERLGYPTDRVDAAEIWFFRETETEQIDFQSLSHIRYLSLVSCGLSNSMLRSHSSLERIDLASGQYPEKTAIPCMIRRCIF